MDLDSKQANESSEPNEKQENKRKGPRRMAAMRRRVVDVERDKKRRVVYLAAVPCSVMWTTL